MRLALALVLLAAPALAADVSQLSDADLRTGYVDICVKQQTANGGLMPPEFFEECEPLRKEWMARQEKLKKGEDTADKQKLRNILGTKK